MKEYLSYNNEQIILSDFEWIFEKKMELFEIYDKYYKSKIKIDDFQEIVTHDPTSKDGKVLGKFSKWLLNLYIKGNLLLEDLEKAKNSLKKFINPNIYNKISPEKKDINKISGLPELAKILDNVSGEGKTKNDENFLIEDRHFINIGEAEIYKEDDDVLIVIPKTIKASKFYGYNTEWCTIAPEQFNSYNKAGKLYIIIDKHKLNTDDKTRRIQIHLETNSVMDIYDDDLDADSRKNIYPKIKEIIGTSDVNRIKFISVDSYTIYNGDLLRYTIGDSVSILSVKTDKPVTEHVYKDIREPTFPYFEKIIENDLPKILFVQGKDSKWGVIDVTGKVLIEPKLESYQEDNFNEVEIILNGKSGLMNHSGEIIIYPEFDKISTTYGENFLRYTIDGNVDVFNAKANKTVTGHMYKDIRKPTFSYFEKIIKNDLPKILFVQGKDSKWGVIDVTGKVLIEPKLESYQEDNFNEVEIILNGKSGLMNHSGEIIIYPEFDKIVTLFDPLYKKDKSNGFSGLQNEYTEDVIKFVFDNNLKKGAMIGSDYKPGDKVNFQLDGISPLKYISVPIKVNNHILLLTKINGKLGVINTYGKKLLDNIYDNIRILPIGLYNDDIYILELKKNNKYGVTDLKSSKIDIIFDSINQSGYGLGKTYRTVIVGEIDGILYKMDKKLNFTKWRNKTEDIPNTDKYIVKDSDGYFIVDADDNITVDTRFSKLEFDKKMYDKYNFGDKRPGLEKGSIRAEYDGQYVGHINYTGDLDPVVIDNINKTKTKEYIPPLDEKIVW